MAMRSHRGPTLPYKLLAGVVPCPGGWLVAGGKLQGITLSPEEPRVFDKLIDVLDWKPAFQILALCSPVGLLDEQTPGGRACDREARRVLGRKRGAAVVSAPSRSVLRRFVAGEDASTLPVSAVGRKLLPKVAELSAEMSPYWQRTIFEVHPELCFFQLNEDTPLSYPKHTADGRAERRALLVKRLPGVDRIVDAKVKNASTPHLLDAAAALWTARRIMAHAVARLPEFPEWDNEGLRMEIVR